MFGLSEDFEYLEDTWVDVEELKEFINMYAHGNLEDLFEDKKPKKRKYNKSTGRNYKRDYEQFQSKPEQIKDRASRNSARAEEKENGNVSKGDGKDVHHIDGNPQNNNRKNIKVVSKSENRGKK
tara:strand:+ start:104 stop:475 length:372 start_codon:yes stop_codon:yes gene_type:complete